MQIQDFSWFIIFLNRIERVCFPIHYTLNYKNIVDNWRIVTLTSICYQTIIVNIIQK